MTSDGWPAKPFVTQGTTRDGKPTGTWWVSYDGNVTAHESWRLALSHAITVSWVRAMAYDIGGPSA